VWWATEYGIDGLRLDAIKHVPLDWLTDLRTRVEDREIPAPDGRALLHGRRDLQLRRPALCGRFVDPDTMLDGQFDFPFKARVCEALFTPGGRLDSFADLDGGATTAFYGAGALMSTWIGNHDIPRAIHFASRQITDCRAGSAPATAGAPRFPSPPTPRPTSASRWRSW
jgi:hypothetical protein